MASIGKVSAVFTASTSGLTAGVKSASSSFRGLQSETKGLAASMRTLVAIQGAQLFASVASSAASGVRSLVAYSQAQAQVIDDASKMASRLGMTYGEFAGLSLAADLAGVSMETVGKASQKAEIAFANASNGSKTANAAFARLGLSMDQLNKMSSAERFDAIAAAIAGMPSEAERAAASVQVFGKAGAELLPLFSGGAEGIAAARKEADRLGLALTTTQGREVEKMNDSFSMVYKSIEGIVQQVNAYLAPAITRIANAFVKMVGDIGGKNIGQMIGQGIIDGAKYLATVADLIANGFRDMYFAAADVLGVAVTKEAARLKELQVQIEAGTAPQVAVAGSGGFVTQLDPVFAAEVASLTAAVAAQRQPLTVFSDVIAQAGSAISAAMNAPQEDPPRPPPKIEIAPVVVVDVAQAIKGIDSRTSDGIAEMYRIMRGSAGDAQERTAAAAERTADATESIAEDRFAVVEDF
jgi:uncharacterized lipoprotein YehR (DUF1307 family)